MLILGRELVGFLTARRAKNKRTCQPGEIYCVQCRAPRAPAGDMVDYVPVTAMLGNLEAICPACETMMYRRVSLAKLEQVRGNLDITMPQALEHIGESAEPTVNSDLRWGASDHGNAQRRQRAHQAPVRRNRALVAFALLTGARDSALASMKPKHVDLAAGSVYQDAREVDTKYSKSFTTYFLPVGGDARQIVEAWVNYLRREKPWGNDDPLFPATLVELSEARQFEAGLTRGAGPA